MKHRIQLTALAAVAGIMTAGATVSEVTYTYVDGDLGYWGKSKAETIDVAMCINDPALAGMKVKGMKALLNTAEGLSEVSMWLSGELTLENKKNVPDILSVPVLPVDDSYCPYISTTLETPYVLDGSPLYVGYTLTVDDVTTTANKNPLILSPGENPNGFFLHMSKSVLKWKEYSSTIGCVAAIYVQLEGDFPEYSLGVAGMPLTYAEAGKPYTMDVAVSNLGAQAVNSIDYSYSVGGVTGTGHADLVTPVAPDLVNKQTVTLDFLPLPDTGNYEMTLTLDKVNGQANLSAAATATGTVSVKPFVPVSRPLMEEFTGTWCGWCTRGYMAMELIAEQYGDNVVAIAYHNGDSMTITNDYPVNVGGFPSGALNRTLLSDPYYGNHSNVDFGVSIDLEDAMAQFAPGDLAVKAYWTDEAKTQIAVETTVRLLDDYDNAPYTIGYTLVGNGMSSPTWKQSNSYAGRTESGYLAEICSWPSSVIGLVFNDVAMDIDGYMGVEGSVPASVQMGVPFTHEFAYDISANKLVQYMADPANDTWVMAYIIDTKTKKVVNANKCRVYDPAGVSATGAAEVLSTQWYDLCGRQVSSPANGLYIKVDRMADGTVKSHKTVVK